MVEALIRLHNFCIDQQETYVENVQKKNSANLSSNALVAHLFGGSSVRKLLNLIVMDVQHHFWVYVIILLMLRKIGAEL